MDQTLYAVIINRTNVELHRDNRFDNDHHSSGDADNASGDADATPPIWWESGPVLLLALLYTLVIGGGIFGNASLLLTVLTQTSARFRNPLLVALCAADLMVAAVAAPLTLFTLLAMQQRWSLSTFQCKGIYFMQVSAMASGRDVARIIYNAYLWVGGMESLAILLKSGVPFNVSAQAARVNNA